MISLVVPAYNEEESIADLIRTVLKAGLGETYELIIVNDGSTDRTGDILKHFARKYPFIKPISYSPNRGLGHALRTGFSHARGRIIVTMDADLSHPPSLIPSLIRGLDGHDIAIGSRYASVHEKTAYKRYTLSRLTNYATRMVTATGDVKDVTSGFRAYRADVLREMATHESGFEVEIEILVRLLKHHARVQEVPLPLIDREKGRSKFSIARNGPRYCFSLLRIFFYRWL